MSLPQREGRPALDLSPDATPETAGWAESYDNPANDLNKPVAVRKGAAPENGWTKEVADVVRTEDI